MKINICQNSVFWNIISNGQNKIHCKLNPKTQLTFGTTEALIIMCKEECLSVPLE
jgi:hypothetical protein